MENNNDKYITTAKAREQLGVAVLTLHNWEKAGKIETLKTAGGHRLYNVDKYLRDNKNKIKSIKSVESVKTDKTDKTNKTNKTTKVAEADDVVEAAEAAEAVKAVKDVKVVKSDETTTTTTTNKTKKNICYIRVSTVGNKALLKKQKEYMMEKYPSYTVIEDIGSPLIFKKVGLKKIIDLASEGNIDTLVITNNNNLTTYGFDILEYLIVTKFGGKIIVDSPPEDHNSKTDMVDDIMQIMSMCTDKMNELRNKLK